MRCLQNLMLTCSQSFNSSPIRSTILAVAVLLSPLCIAGEAAGTVTALNVRDVDGLIYVQVSGAPTARPACASATTYFMIKAENTDSGKRLFATLLAAKLAGVAVRVYGANTCTRWADGEDILEVSLLP
jgi:hypothetical protein